MDSQSSSTFKWFAPGLDKGGRNTLTVQNLIVDVYNQIYIYGTI